jgi:hypothetical protein
MIYKILVLAVLFLSGCGEVDKDELKALNKPVKIKQSKNISIEINSSLNQDEVKAVSAVREKQSIKKEENTTQALLVPVKQDILSLAPVKQTEMSADEKYKLALVQIRKERETAIDESKLELSLAKLEQAQKLSIKEKELQMSLAKTKSTVDIANIELKKIQENEKTKQLAQTQMHTETLIENENKKLLEEKKLILNKEQLDFYKIAAAVIAFLIFLSIMIYYFIKKRSSENELKMHEDELSYQLQMKMVEQQSKNIDKMLEIVTNNDLSKNVQKELLYAIKESQKKTFVFDQKPRKGLIFRK